MNRPLKVPFACLSVFVLLIVPAVLGAAGPGSWIQLGPYEEPISAVAFDPADPTVLYAAISPSCDTPPCRHGLLRSDDGGESWTAIGEPDLPEPLRAFELAVDPASRETIYVRNQQLLRSDDAGRSFSVVSSAVTDESLLAFGVAGDESGSTIYIADVAGRIFRSTDRGDTWSASEDLIVARDLAVDPRDPQVAYVVGWSGLYRSTDGGARWSQLSDVATNFFDSLLIDGRAPSTLYLLDKDRRILKSIDGGLTWQPLVNAPDRPNFLAIDPLTSTLYAIRANTIVWRSEDGGETWDSSQQGPAGWFLTDMTASGGTAFAAAENGIWRSLDGGAVWREANQGLRPAMVEHLAVDPAGQILWAGTWGEDLYELPGSFLGSPDGGADWRYIDVPAGSTAGRLRALGH